MITKLLLRKELQQGPMSAKELFDLIPSRKIKNYIYKNNGRKQFENKTDEWGFNQHLNSNGGAYADLDNDGDLDLVVNNINDYASIYKNNSTNNFIKINLDGPQNNVLGLGTIIKVKTGESVQHYVHYLNRGYQSSVANEIICGIGSHNKVDQIEVIWPDGKGQIIENIDGRKTITISYNKAGTISKESKPQVLVQEVNLNNETLEFKHVENEYDDFVKEILLPHKYSTQGPTVSKGDVNGDGLEDIFITGAKGQASKVLIQSSSGQFENLPSADFKKDKNHEDIGATFIDGDKDGDLDLYVVSGGNEVSENDPLLFDRYYVNDGKGRFSRTNAIPKIAMSGGQVVAGDFDKDGDEDLLVCGRTISGKYPLPASSVLLQNNNGKFSDVTIAKAPDLKELGLVTDAIFSDIDNDNDLDILLVGEWMGLNVLKNNEGTFVRKDHASESGVGWWYAIEELDINQDGNMDYLLGNLGLNNKFGVKADKPFHVFCNDFDDSGNLDIVLSKERGGKFLPVRGRECSSQQMPFIKEKFPSFKSFAEADLAGIYGKENLDDAVHYTANNFESSIMLNNGDGSFTRKKLPIEAQYGPSLFFEVIDINNDGNMDIVGGGNIYNSEVETVRYDASKGYILLGDGKGNFKNVEQSGLLLSGNIKDLATVTIDNEKYFVVVKKQRTCSAIQIDLRIRYRIYFLKFYKKDWHY